MARKTFVFYESWKEVIDGLSNDVQLEIYQAITEYAINGELVELKPMAKVAFAFIRQDLDRDATAYAEKCRINRENASKGGAPKGNENAKKQPKTTETTGRLKKQPNQPYYDNDNDIVEKDISNDISKKKAEAFRPPSLDEIKIYCHERKNDVDVQKFIDFYKAKGWMIGKNKMKDWKAAVRTWERGDNHKPRLNIY